MACRVARCARSSAARRERHEQKAAAQTKLTTEDRTWDDRDDVLYQELNRLPHRYRLAVTVCDLEGLTQEQAARRLGWPAGTMRSRLSRGRARLRDRLTRRGLGAVVPGSACLVRPAVPAALVADDCGNRHRGRRHTGGDRCFGLGHRVNKRGHDNHVYEQGKATPGRRADWRGDCQRHGHARASGDGGQPARRLPLKPSLRRRQPRELRRLRPCRLRPSPERLSPIARARIDVAKKLRDNAYILFREGHTDLATYLGAQRRYDDIVGAVTLKSDVDRVRFNEIRVAGWKQVEETYQGPIRQRREAANEVLSVELDRLEAEDALAKGKAKLSAVADTAKERLKVTKQIRDAMYRSSRADRSLLKSILSGRNAMMTLPWPSCRSPAETKSASARIDCSR